MYQNNHYSRKFTANRSSPIEERLQEVHSDEIMSSIVIEYNIQIFDSLKIPNYVEEHFVKVPEPAL